MFLKASGENFLSITGMHTHFLFCLVHQYGRLGYGGAKQVTGNFILYAKNEGTHNETIHIFIFPLERKSKIGDSAIISSLPFTPETKISSGSLYPTLLNLPHPTLLHIWWSYYLLESKFYFAVLNHFCDSWLKIDGLFYFAK